MISVNFLSRVTYYTCFSYKSKPNFQNTSQIDGLSKIIDLLIQYLGADLFSGKESEFVYMTE